MTSVGGGIWTKEWSKRPHEEAAFYNPAFCGELIYRATKSYCGAKKQAFPLPLLFLVLSMSLAPNVRSVLPGKSNTLFESWLAENEALAAQISEKAMRLRPVSRESLLFLGQVGAIKLSADGASMGDATISLQTALATTEETKIIRRTAGLVGRWFAFQGSTYGILQGLGIRL